MGSPESQRVVLLTACEMPNPVPWVMLEAPKILRIFRMSLIIIVLLLGDQACTIY